MCGIAGKLYFDPARPVEPALLERMHKVIEHRGPDDAGVYHDGPIGLVNRRLAIIDLSAAGHGPMPNARGDVWITYNGEVYNFQALRAELEAEGVRFRSRTDTEVVLALYERDGVDCLRRLRGMFAFAIWDARTRTLFLARDRAGKKPLVYYQDRERFLFASEPKSILEDPDVPVAADTEAVHHYLTYGYVPSPHSAFRGFRKLPPAHYALVRDGRLTVERYWTLRYEPKPRLTEDEWCERIVGEMREAVRLRMIADVPLGAFLSGGIDSSAVVALMAEMSSQPVKTFSIGFEEKAYNELPYARAIASRFGTEHHEFIVKPDAVEILPDLVWHYGEPYADSSAIPTWYLAKMTRQHVTVALNGDAGDENFAGYERYAANQLATRFDRLPAALRRGLEVAARGVPDRGHPRGLYRRGRRFLGAIAQEPARRAARWIEMFSNNWKRELYTPEFARAVGTHDSVELLVAAFRSANGAAFVDAMLAADVALYLPDDLLVKVDIASMAHSLEARSPLVDHRMMELAASIPPELKLRGRTTKYIFKRALYQGPT
ncbi:MAG: asparagine synthase (glutamine-hydrolyzing) [Gemmatimonadetes bacterium]|nr:asparagine synthase (glutamine-hydrolyzing) [Gemmatimonadota bacterium]